jgi:hypothetical protein
MSSLDPTLGPDRLGLEGRGSDTDGVDAAPRHGYWKSLADLEPTGSAPAAGAPEVPTAGDVVDPLNRRNFMQLMGASMALAGVAGAGCKRYDKRGDRPPVAPPRGQVPGQTAAATRPRFDFVGTTQALLVTSYEGRPIKLDGNPEHPVRRRRRGRGHRPPRRLVGVRPGLDPPRLRPRPLAVGAARRQGRDHRGLPRELGRIHAADGNPTGIRVLAEASSSPTLAALQASACSSTLPGAAWHEWEPVSFDNERAGMRLAFGKPMRAIRSHLDQGRPIIVALDCDIFTEHPASAALRPRLRPQPASPTAAASAAGKMNRLYAVESAYSPHRRGRRPPPRAALRADPAVPAGDRGSALSGGAAAGAAVVGEAKVSRVPEGRGQGRSLAPPPAGSAVLVVGRQASRPIGPRGRRQGQRALGGSQRRRTYDDPDAQPARPTATRSPR